MKTKHAKLLVLAAVLAFGALGFVGCSDNSSPTNSGNNNQGQHSSHYHTVAISNFAFSPSTVTVAVGDTVVWTNSDSAPHTVTSDSGTEMDSAQLSNGQKYQHIFGTSGVFAYHCSVHPTMHGSVTVQ